jgi:ADP-ribose pyrophosphatase YjhB (NUDIX family)
MDFRTGAFDIWVFRQDPDAIRYLLLHTSQEKADRWFNGGRFWQIPCDFVGSQETLVEAAKRCLKDFALECDSLWAVEHSYTIFNRRRESIEQILVLAADLQKNTEPDLTWEHSEYRWCTASECEALLGFRGLLEGLAWARHCVTEANKQLPELKLV